MYSWTDNANILPYLTLVLMPVQDLQGFVVVLLFLFLACYNCFIDNQMCYIK